MNKNKLVLLFLFFLMSSISFCYGQQGDDLYGDPVKNKNYSDKRIDTVGKDRYRLSRKEFLEIYGVDDTSKALIKYYFSKRANGLAYIITYGAGLSLEVFFLASLSNDEHVVSVGMVLVAALYTAVIFIPSHVLLGLGLESSFKYSKKHLHRDLMSYFKGHGIPEKHMKKMSRTRYYWR